MDDRGSVMRASIRWVALLPLLGGCGFALGAGGGVHHADVYYEDAYYDASGGGVYFDADYGRRVDYRRLPVARGHLPAPGRCRIWLPGAPSGRQGRSGSCRSLEHRVPAGAWLLVRPRAYPEVVELIAYDYRRHGTRTRYVYDVRTRRRVNPY